MASTLSLMLLAGAYPYFSAATSSPSYDPIAGWTPVSDVVEHSKLDLDTLAMETNADLQTEEGFSAAYEAYSIGGNSMYGENGFRTIEAFSTEAEEKLGGEKWFDVYQHYWGAPDYADRFTSAACTGTGSYETVEPVVRAEACTKGAQYQNVWMYVIHEMELAVGHCNDGELGAADGGPHHWDEAWAFYAGSLEGESGNADGDGKMLYALAQKRCGNFGTCGGDDGVTGTAAVNDAILEQIVAGSGYLLEGKCAEAEDAKERIVKLMAVPLLQGTLRYLYRADPASDYDGDSKHWAELWAFAAAILPLINECSADVAHTVMANSDIDSEHAPVSDGFVSVKEGLESIYSCLGMTCDQVGGLLAGDSTTDYVPGLEPCGGGAEEPTEPVDSGCYRDSRDDRRLAMGPMSSGDMTPTLCNEICVGQYASFYAVQYGRECWCGDDSTDYAKLGALDMTECAHPCSGDGDLSCGGFDSFEIFSLPAETSMGHLGCYADDRDDRLFRAGKIDLEENSVEGCRAACSGSPRFGLQYGRECWCGTDDEGYTKHGASTDCDYPCKGNEDYTCGGFDAMNIFET